MAFTPQALWHPDRAAFSVDGRIVSDLMEKGAASAVAQDARANIGVLADRLQREEINLQEFYTGLQQETKYLHIAEAAIGRGGFDQLTDEHLERVEQIVLDQWEGVEGKFPGMRAFVEDINSGRYGTDILSPGVANRAAMYGDIGRSTQANERVRARQDIGHDVAEAILGALDHCPTCKERADLGEIPIDEMMNEWAIGNSECGGNCGCDIVTRSSGAQAEPDDEAPSNEGEGE